MLALLLLNFASPTCATAEEPDVATMVQRAAAYLAGAQSQDGSYSKHLGTGITSLATTGLLHHGRSPQDPLVAKSLAFLAAQVQPDGGIYQTGSRYRNYETCLAMMCFSAANQTGAYAALLQGAEAFVKQLQWNAEEGHDLASTSYGGAGYGKHNRPDLSNTSFLIDALKTVGNAADDPALQRALVFVSRCQNLETEHNQTAFAAKNPDGGFYYTVAAGGSSQAGETATGGLRSYGSMTYAGLKSMIFAGVSVDDPRVQAAYQWTQRHYALSENPGMGQQGYFYYLHTLAKALDAIGDAQITAANGTKHDWRQELLTELARRQQENGSWFNPNQRWLENDPNLVTGYVLLTLAYCQER